MPPNLPHFDRTQRIFREKIDRLSGVYFNRAVAGGLSVLARAAARTTNRLQQISAVVSAVVVDFEINFAGL